MHAGTGFSLLLGSAGPGLAQTGPAAAFKEWNAEFSDASGTIRFSGQSHAGYYRAYVCTAYAAARAVIAAIPRGGPIARQKAAMRAALRRGQCAVARGSFRVTAAGTARVEINNGYEAEEYWMALGAVAPTGKAVGLVFDSSPYAP